MEMTNLQLVQSLYASYLEDPSRGAEFLERNLGPEALWSTAADSRMPGLKFAANRKGAKEVGQYFKDMATEWKLLDYKIHHFTAQDDRVIAFGTGQWQNLQTNRIVKTDKVDIFKVKDGQITEFTEVFDTASVVDAAIEQPESRLCPENET